MQVCWKFGIGQCPFGDNKCWFIHEEKTESTEYTCKLCGKAFLNLPDLMKHKKANHIQTVQVCKNGMCIYGKNCWFKHEGSERIEKGPLHENNEDVINVNNEDIQRIMKMMETLTKRIVNMEATNNSEKIDEEKNE